MLASRTLGGSLPLFANCSSASCTSAVADNDPCQQNTHTVTQRLHGRPEAYILVRTSDWASLPPAESEKGSYRKSTHTLTLTDCTLTSHTLTGHTLTLTHSLAAHSHSHTHWPHTHTHTHWPHTHWSHTHTLTGHTLTGHTLTGHTLTGRTLLCIHLGPSVLSWLGRCSLK